LADKPEIIAPSYGAHNEMLDQAIKRLEVAGSYKDLSTIIIIPSLGAIPPKVVSSWLNLISPPNGKVYRMFAMGMEVGEAFSQSISNILSHPDLSKFKYILTMETDNIPQPDGLVKLLAQMEAHPEFACIGGLYWTKGPEGVPQIWGDPHVPETNFRPQRPVQDSLVECCGTGMGFNVFRLDMFKDPNLRKPWFKTLNGINGTGVGTQDLYFWGDARAKGYRCAIDCSVLVGHYDYTGTFGPPDTVW
jgi:hypothetical protein